MNGFVGMGEGLLMELWSCQFATFAIWAQHNCRFVGVALAEATVSTPRFLRHITKHPNLLKHGIFHCSTTFHTASELYLTEIYVFIDSSILLDKAPVWDRGINDRRRGKAMRNCF